MTRKRFDTAPQFNVDAEGLIIQQVAGSTVPLFEIKDHTGSALMSVTADGEMSTAAPSTIDTLTVDTQATLPASTSIGTVSSTEISYVDGVTGAIQAQIDSKAALDSASLTGIPTAPTAISGTTTTQIATTQFVRTEISNLISSSPATLDTLDELAAALGDDPNFATTVTTSLASKSPLASPTFTGVPAAPTAAVGTNTTQLATTAFVQSANPTGSVIAFAGSTAPAGWLLCNNVAVSRITYAALFTLIGTTYGVGDGSSTFNVPDLRGRTVAGVDNMGGTAASRLTSTTITGGGDAVGETGGAQTHTLDISQVPAVAATGHTHGAGTYSVNDHGHGPGSFGAAIGATNGNPNRIGYIAGTIVGPGTATYSVEAGGLITGTANFNHYTPVYGSSGGATPGVNGTSSGPSANAGGGSAHNNVQPTMVLNYIIKA